MNSNEVHTAFGEKQSGVLQSKDLQQFTQLHGLQGFVRIAKRRRIWILGSIMLCMVLALIVSVMTKPVYESTATIELNKSSGGSMDVGISDILSQSVGPNVDSLLVDQQTETAILKGDSLALEVIQRLSLASRSPLQSNDSKPVDKSVGQTPAEDSPEARTRSLAAFKDGLRVNPIRGTRLIQVAYNSQDPIQAAQIANSIIESYKNQYLQSHYNATSEASDWLTRQLSQLKANVEESEKRLTDFEKETGIISLNLTPAGTGNESGGGGGGQIHSVVIEKLDALNSELTTAEANRIEKEAIYRLVESGSGNVIVGLQNDPLAVQSNSMVLTQGGGVSNLQQLQQQENELTVNIAQASTTLGANNRHLKELQTQLHALQAQIRLELQRIELRAQADFQLAQQTEAEIRRRFDQQQVAASSLNEKTVQFAVLSQEAYSRKKLYEDLFTKLQEANVSAGLKATNITVVDPARPQSRPVRPKRLINLALGMLLGVFFGFSAAFAVESLDRTVGDPIEVEEITGKPVIGVVPSFEEARRVYGTWLVQEAQRRKEKPTTGEFSGLRPVWMIEHPASAAAEGLRGLRTSIMLSRGGECPKVILVTSCIPGEGKTTITSNLAVAFAHHDKRVIIVEADMRRPNLKRRMDFPGEIGLSNVLTGSASSDEAILRGMYVPTLDVLPAGPRPPMPSEILGSHVFDELLEQLRSQYDIIFVDSPPALLVTDAVSISLKVDAVVWVSQAGVVTRPQLNRAAQLIERNRMPVIGFVVNRLTRNLGGYDYDYQYEAYDSYGEENPDA